MVLEISIAVIAVAFLALVIALIVMIASLIATLKDFQRKSATLNSLFKSVENMGDVIECKTSSLKEELKKRCEWAKISKMERERLLEYETSNAVADLVELTGIGLRLWENFKKRRD